MLILHGKIIASIRRRERERKRMEHNEKELVRYIREHAGEAVKEHLCACSCNTCALAESATRLCAAVEALVSERDQLWMENEGMRAFLAGDGKVTISYADLMDIVIHDLTAETATIPLRKLWKAKHDPTPDDAWDD
jgi:hypothetical protein